MVSALAQTRDVLGSRGLGQCDQGSSHLWQPDAEAYPSSFALSGFWGFKGFQVLGFAV